ncbi:MAG: undecaprenyldiphospho-muramoylpentapeptide beta-N-acetylglucosaminyltransferase [Propionibacteriaceae bacterium]|nr:undecaprenyldiphospho-muramoylpentapeptide beta-N-acetylglucosaminyltransferase [Propionibacteriaceae bacterium]
MSRSIVLAGGGTTGHLSPLVATAQALTSMGDVRLTCVGTAKGLETSVIPAAGLELKLISADPLPRRLTLDLVKLPFRMVSSMRQAGSVLDEAGAEVVVGFGGYVSLPVYLAAWRRHLPIVMHEQNALPGLANKVMAPRAAAVLVSFPGTPLPKAQCVGLPVRAGVAALSGGGRAAAQPDARAAFGLQPGGPVLLVSGGSQGARSINNAVVSVRDDLLAAGISVLHVWGSANFPAGSAVVEGSQGARYVPLAYVDDMAQAYAAADLMLARAGAATVAETAIVGLPCIFVPFPHGNGEQVRNAEPLVRAGAAQVIMDADLTPDALLSAVTRLLDADNLARMSAAAQSVMQPGAAEAVAKIVLSLGQRP